MIVKLREVGVRLSQGETIAQAVRAIICDKIESAPSCWGTFLLALGQTHPTLRVMQKP